MTPDPPNPDKVNDRGIRKHPTQARAVDKRERILDSAQRLIHECGYAATTVARVARDAGVAEATVYQLFAGRDAVLYALVERGSDQIDAANDEAIRAAEGKPWPELVRALVDIFYRISRDDPSLQSVQGAARTVPALRELERDQVMQRADRMAGLAAQVAGLKPDPALTTTALVLMLGIADTVRHALLRPEAEAAALIEEASRVAEARWRSLGAR